MLRNTLILPESDARLAASMLQDAIDRLDVILMIVFGKGDEVLQIVDWADQLCEKTRIGDAATIRHVVWVRDAQSTSVRNVLAPLVDLDELPRALVLNFHDQVRGTIAQGETARPLHLERLFLLGGETGPSGGPEDTPAGPPS